jgi:hypothetical protein
MFNIKPISFLGAIIRNLYFLFLANGMLIASVFYFFTESRYEKELFTAITRKIKAELPVHHTHKLFAEKALLTTSYLQDRRYEVFGKAELQGIKANLFHSSTIDLMTNNGACGSYAVVLARILKSNNIKVRIGQMKIDGHFGGHMIVEALLDKRWVVMDPTYALYFENPDGSWATFSQLKHNWNYYKIQVPEGYKPEYNYEGVRYTNWNKIPVISQSIKGLLNITIGRDLADSISIRPYLLRIYHKLAWLTFLAWLVVVLYTFKRIRQNKHAQKKTEAELKYIHKTAKKVS